MRRILSKQAHLTTVTTAALLSVGTLPASAAVLTEPIHPPRVAAPEGKTNAICSTRADVTFSPGISLTTSSGTLGSGDETGSIVCVGTFNGHRVTGPGSFGTKGTYTAICVLGQVSGRYSITVPTDAGPMHFAPTFTATPIGVVSPIEGSQPGMHLTGLEVFVFKRGNCVTAPVTEAMINDTLIVTSQNG
jgi:hypothetical protein